MKRIFILLIVLLGLLVISCGKKWDYEITKKESIEIGNDIIFYLLTLEEKEGGSELDALQITNEGFNKYNVGDKLTKEELDNIKISEDTLASSDLIILKNQWDAEEYEYTINKDDLKNIEARHMATGNYDKNDLSSIENLKNDIHFVEEEK